MVSSWVLVDGWEDRFGGGSLVDSGNVSIVNKKGGFVWGRTTVWVSRRLASRAMGAFGSTV